ncbi:hypothetical protein EVAR_21446_1 [Eumeta japonica]|uniref:Uncharacterized protein n=1 Tax=Eumeta variegata TaxID=151549 RepID=A0A4C1VH21_EUMVA|nr:hypothetical protein EVAR_21446_1 [Eumeta japonica]
MSKVDVHLQQKSKNFDLIRSIQICMYVRELPVGQFLQWERNAASQVRPGLELSYCLTERDRDSTRTTLFTVLVDDEEKRREGTSMSEKLTARRSSAFLVGDPRGASPASMDVVLIPSYFVSIDNSLNFSLVSDSDSDFTLVFDSYPLAFSTQLFDPLSTGVPRPHQSQFRFGRLGRAI